VSAVEAAGLVEAWKGEGPFAGVAPTDTAFDARREGAVAGLLEEEKRERRVSVLTHHVGPGRVTSAELAGGTVELETV